MNRFLVIASPLCLAIVAGTVSAHHSVTANFDPGREVEIRGRVVVFNYVSPHASMVIDGVAYENGAALSEGVERWEIESSAVKGLRSRGIEAETFQPGDAIVVRGTPHRRGLNRVNSSTFLAGDGSPLALNAPPRPGPAVAPSVDGVGRVEGRWQPPYQAEGDRSALPLNEAGYQAWSAYNQTQSPANTCEPMSIPVIFNAPGYYVDIRIGDGVAVIRNEAYDVHRTVRIGDEFAPADPAAQWGHARGRIEGDALIVESRDYPTSQWGLGAATQINGGGGDVPSSEQKTVVERFSTSADGLSLYYDYILSDPVYMSSEHEARVVLRRVADDAPWYDYDCNVSAAAQFSRPPGASVLATDTE